MRRRGFSLRPVPSAIGLERFRESVYGQWAERIGGVVVASRQRSFWWWDAELICLRARDRSSAKLRSAMRMCPSFPRRHLPQFQVAVSATPAALIRSRGHRRPTVEQKSEHHPAVRVDPLPEENSNPSSQGHRPEWFSEFETAHSFAFHPTGRGPWFCRILGSRFLRCGFSVGSRCWLYRRRPAVWVSCLMLPHRRKIARRSITSLRVQGSITGEP